MGAKKRDAGYVDDGETPLVWLEACLGRQEKEV